MLSEKIKNTRAQLKKNILLSNAYYSNQTQRKQVFDLLERLLQVGESNSALLIGPRGAGKTRLVNNVLNELQTHANFESNCVVVHLNGLLHTDDKLALIAITSQLNLDNVVGDKVFGSFAENLAFLLACLRAGNRKTSKSVLIIIDEFDLFCSHNNQTLLYNLFDVSQSAQAPICVLGISCRLDVIELLEKRVKSRFSHRQFFLFAGFDPANPGECKSEMDYYLTRIENMLSLHVEKKVSKSYVSQWNKHVSHLIRNKQFQAIIQRLLDICLTETILKNMLLNVIVELDGDELVVEAFERQLQFYERDQMVEQLLDLSVLELCLLIAIKHHSEIYDNQPLNFEIIYSRYVRFANASSNVQTVQRAVVFKAYEHLISMEVLQHVTGCKSRVQKEYEMHKLLVTRTQIEEAVKRWQGLPTDVAQWAMTSLL